MSQGMPAPRKRKPRKDTTALGLAPDQVSVDGIEVTQVVQDMSHSVTMIAKKTTVVRVYLSRPAGNAIKLRGVLGVRRTASGTVTSVPSLNTVQVKPALNGQLRAKREDLRLSLNFLLPASLTSAGNIFINVKSLTEVSTGEEVACVNCADQVRRVTFRDAPPLRVRLLRLSYKDGDSPVTHLAKPLDLSLIKSWLSRAYPISELIFSDAIVEGNIKPPFKDSTCNRANAQLTAIRNLDIDGGTDQRTHYFGLVADSGDFMRGCANKIPGSPDPTAVASGPAGPAGFSWDTDGSYGDWYTAHELAHTFGRFHPGFCDGNSSDDPEYPFDNGQLSKADGVFTGLDVGDQALGVPMKALPGVQWHDVMTYCERQWMSSYTYEGIRLRLAAEGALGPSPAPLSFGLEAETEPEVVVAAADALEVYMASGNFINIVGTINLTKKSGSILYVNPVSNVLAPKSKEDSPVQIRVRDGEGQLLQEYPATFKLNSCQNPDEDRTGIIDATIPSQPEARVLEMVLDGAVVDTYRAGTVPSDVANVRRTEATDEAMTFAWDSPEAEDESVTYNVQLSTDEGQTWQTVAVGHPSPDVTIDRNQFAEGTNVRVRVIATDGFTNRIVTSDSFSVDEQDE
jgi:hypothetical protein